MADREKVINGLECCAFSKHGDKCEQCPYFSGCETEYGAFVELAHDALALLKAQEPIEARLHLCESCTKKYPECDAAIDGIEFGSGIGNDNIIGCTVYVNRWKAQEPEALDAQKQDSDVGCWYDITHNYTLEQVVSALKAQEPHLLTLDEIHDSMVVWLEAGTKLLKIVDGVVLAIGGSERTGAKCFITVYDVCVAAKDNEYNVTWRAWSQRPTKEQREKEPWNRRANDEER